VERDQSGSREKAEGWKETSQAQVVIRANGERNGSTRRDRAMGINL
jgi:hypothetical protein